MQNEAHKLTLVKRLMMKILNLILAILLEFQNIKAFLQKVIFQIGLKQFSSLENLKALSCGHMLLAILKSKKLLEYFRKKIFQKKIKNSVDLNK